MSRACLSAAAFTGLLLFSILATADEIQLVNGDTVKGHVVSLDEKQLKVKSEILGELTIERKNVLAIQLYDDVQRSPASSPPTLSPSAKPIEGDKKTSSLDSLLKELRWDGSGGVDVEALLKKFEAEGGNADAIGELKKNMPLFGAPKVQGYVEKQLKGLLEGSIQVDDIRRDAIRAREETRKAIKELGPGAEEALAPYLGILDKFIKDSEPPAEKKEKTK